MQQQRPNLSTAKGWVFARICLKHCDKFELESELFLLVFFGDDFAALIKTAIITYGMRQNHLTAIAALYQVDCLQRIMGSAAITAPF